MYALVCNSFEFFEEGGGLELFVCPKKYESVIAGRIKDTPVRKSLKFDSAGRGGAVSYVQRHSYLLGF